jgi:hypothetical protein
MLFLASMLKTPRASFDFSTRLVLPQWLQLPPWECPPQTCITPNS